MRRITCVLTLFMMLLQVMKPPLVIDHQSKERNMEDLTIKLCKKKFCTYLTKMKEM